MELFRQNVRYAWRQLRRNPAIAVLSTVTLAIGIGANTAIFSFINAVILRPLPYPNADRLAVIWSGLGDTNRAPASRFELFQIRQLTKEFDQVGGIWVTNGALPAASQNEHVGEQIKIGIVTTNLLPLLCPKPAFGRFFSPEDETRNGPGAVMISYGLWARRFGSDPATIGRTIRIQRETAVIIGVLPPNFSLIFPDDASVPPNVDAFYTIPIDASEPAGPAFLHLLGRLRAGTTFARAQAEANGVAAKIDTFDGKTGISHFRLTVYGLQADDFRSARSMLLLLFGAVMFVLLIGCANVANLLMARARQRNGERITRMALGASTARLVRQFLTEAFLLSLIGGVAAVFLAWVTVRGILATGPTSFANIGEIGLDFRVLSFTFLVVVLTTAIFGLLPVLSICQTDLAQDLKQGRRLSGGRSGHWFRFLISAEVALAFVLLIGTGLLIRTFINVLHVNPGFRAEGVFTFRISGSDYAILRQLQQSLAHLPGVRSVAAISHLPLDDTGNWYDNYWKEGTPPERQSNAMADLRSTLPGYFKTVGATLIAGRDFSETDDAAHKHVAIIDDVLARDLWPQGDALGKKINVSDSPKGPYQFERDWLVVVGVVRHVQYHSLTNMVRPQIYLPFPLAPRPTMVMVIRTAGAVSDLPTATRRQVALLGKDVAVSRLSTLSAVVDQAVSESQFAALLATLLAGIALVLACIGIYGVLSYLVAQRTNEIGVRMAIGASRVDVLRMVLIDGFASVFPGLSAGCLLSFVMTPLLGHMLFGVQPESAANYAMILGIVVMLTTLASLIPATRATRVDPVTSLRYE
jgi:putative ABC transport system permease protein